MVVYHGVTFASGLKSAWKNEPARSSFNFADSFANYMRTRTRSEAAVTAKQIVNGKRSKRQKDSKL